MQPVVSIIISTYNRPELLKRAIESVRKQTYKKWELIIVHDGEPSPETIKAIGTDMRIRWTSITHFGNDTRPKNTGILYSKGKYIAFLDDDNTWRPDHLQILVTALEQNPEVAMVYGDRYIVDETGNNQSGQGFTRDFTPLYLLQRNYIDTSDVLVRREALFTVGGFDERYKKYVDWNLWLRMEKYGYTFKRIPLIVTDYYLHKDMKSLKKQDEKGFSVPAWNPVDLEVFLPYLGEIKEPKVAIFSLTYDRLEYTKACFESLHKTAGYKFDHWVLDNGSVDGTQDWIEENAGSGKMFTGFTLMDGNVGISKGSNMLLDSIKAGNYDIIIKVDNDALFLTDGWLAKMVEIWKSYPTLVMSPYVQGLRDNPGGAPRFGYNQIRGEMVGVTKHLGGICTFADIRAYKDFRWDEDSFLHGTQDLEFSQHLLKIGYQPCYLENYFLDHYKGTEGQHTDYPEYFERRKSEKTTKYGQVDR